MYNRRIKVLVFCGAVLPAVFLFRLVGMQLFSDSFYTERIDELKAQQRRCRHLRVVRGEILDRNGEVLAVDRPRFELAVSYELSSVLDERQGRAEMLDAARVGDGGEAAAELRRQLASRRADLDVLIGKIAEFGQSREETLRRLADINERIWQLRTFIAWVRSGPSAEILDKYNRNVNSIPLSEAVSDFEHRYDAGQRLRLTTKVTDIFEMTKAKPILELKGDDDVFAAQVEFLNTEGVEIIVTAKRVYPYGSAAAATIGWVGPPQQRDMEVFAGDELAEYLAGELCGREDGVEYVCEPLLRGRRGRLVYDIDARLVNSTERQFGKDVRLSLDIELQERIESYLSDCGFNPNCRAGMAAVVIDVGSGDILSLVSLPEFDLNRVRTDYGRLVSEACEPLRNRALNQQYPPGSVIKPLILVAALQSGEITADEVISCQAKKAPPGWPSCWLWKRYNWLGHDQLWANNARNALKGSCNIYFSRLADRIEPLVLQNWLWRFGYGHKTSLVARDLATEDTEDTEKSIINLRDFRQAQGQISNLPATETITSFEQLGELSEGERRWFGIGQGNCRATPLQVANAFAALARGGVYKPARLIVGVGDGNDGSLAARDLATETSEKSIINNQQSIINLQGLPQVRRRAIDLGLKEKTLTVVYDGMQAVVNEAGGTANKEFAFALNGFADEGVKVYGKTGSTEKPSNAWFAGFAKDTAGRGIALAVIVEQGRHGSSDAAPPARDIISFCIERGYIGRKAAINRKQSSAN